MALLTGSFQGLTRNELSLKLNRSAAKIFSKLQKHLNMISTVETALTKIRASQTKQERHPFADHDEPTEMRMSQKEYTSLSKYLSLQISLKEYYKANRLAIDFVPKHRSFSVASCTPCFILVGNESASSLQIRLTSQGLKLDEIDDVLDSIAFENKVHVRRPGKTRLFTQAKVDKS